MNESLPVNCFNSNENLVGDHQRCFERKFSPALQKEIFQRSPQIWQNEDFNSFKHGNEEYTQIDGITYLHPKNKSDKQYLLELAVLAQDAEKPTEEDKLIAQAVAYSLSSMLNIKTTRTPKVESYTPELIEAIYKELKFFVKLFESPDSLYKDFDYDEISITKGFNSLSNL